MRVAMISEHASPVALLGGEDAGGQNVYVDQLSRHLGALGHQVDIFTRRDNAGDPETIAWAPGVRVINLQAGPVDRLKKDLLWPYMPELRDRILAFSARETTGYDLIHAHFWMSGWVGCELRRALGLPVVQTFHALGAVKRHYQGAADTSPAERFAVEARIVREADRIIASCPAERDELQLYYGADESRIAIVPCGVNTETFYPVPKAPARRALGLPARAQIVLQVGRMVPRKGVEEVIRATALLLDRDRQDRDRQDRDRYVADRSGPNGRPLYLVVAGGETERPADTPEIRRLMRLADSLGIGDRVIFSGQVPQARLRDFYSAADVFVTTPWYEPFGMTPLEAMACGTPVIASAVGGLTYSVIDGETGLLVPPQDPIALADQLGSLLDAPALRQCLADRGRSRVTHFFTWPRISDRIAHVYAEVTGIAPPAARVRSVSPTAPAAEGEALTLLSAPLRWNSSDRASKRR